MQIFTALKNKKSRLGKLHTHPKLLRNLRKIRLNTNGIISSINFPFTYPGFDLYVKCINLICNKNVISSGQLVHTPTNDLKQ